jgi:hypothetical protein
LALKKERLRTDIDTNGPGRVSVLVVTASPSWTVLLFGLGVSVLTGILFGVAPAWTTSHADPVEALRGANRSVNGRKSLVIGQAAMSIIRRGFAGQESAQPGTFAFATEGRYLVYPVTFCFRTETVAVDGKTSRPNCPIPWQRSFPFQQPSPSCHPEEPTCLRQVKNGMNG